LLLEVADIRKSYGGVAALHGVSFGIDSGCICGLIGPNGAGKTTLFDIVCGRVRPDAGTVRVDGADLTAMPPYERARRGIARTFQECRILADETCLDNVLFAVQPKPLGGALRRMLTFDTTARRRATDEARRLLRLTRLEPYADRKAGALSFGQKRLLEIVSALVAQPRIILFDEPASGINPALLDDLHRFILDRHAELRTLFVIVEHNMEFLMSLSDRVIVMHQGAVLEDGTPTAIRENPRVIEAYLG
jgi:ABC-type branched-subunit amino acid transport system ATPase component